MVNESFRQCYVITVKLITKPSRTVPIFNCSRFWVENMLRTLVPGEMLWKYFAVSIWASPMMWELFFFTSEKLWTCGRPCDIPRNGFIWMIIISQIIITMNIMKKSLQKCWFWVCHRRIPGATAWKAVPLGNRTDFLILIMAVVLVSVGIWTVLYLMTTFREKSAFIYLLVAWALLDSRCLHCQNLVTPRSDRNATEAAAG